jgi:hypothetical protein
MIFYLMSQLYMYYGRYWPVTYSHASIHLVANVTNIILYHEIIMTYKDNK